MVLGECHYYHKFFIFFLLECSECWLLYGFISIAVVCNVKSGHIYEHILILQTGLLVNKMATKNHITQN